MDEKTLLKELQGLYDIISPIGKDGENGTTRLSWSPEFVRAQRNLVIYAENIGLQVETDGLGNTIMTLAGKENLPPLYLGSHLDTVPHGGSFDGFTGILVPLACAKIWHDEGFVPTRPIKIIAFAEEEGTRFGRVCIGSAGMTNTLPADCEETYKTAEGISLGELLEVAGYSGAANSYHLDTKGMFLELHIEQGIELEEKQCNLGIVSSIVGISHSVVTIKGKTNHAGTTPMDLRHDALAAAAAFIFTVYHKALASQRKFVATVGQINVVPGAQNIVPGEVTLSLEIRAEADEPIRVFWQELNAALQTIAKEYKVEASVQEKELVPAVPMDGTLRKVIEQCINECGYTYMHMPSWAGHDSQLIGRVMPTAMMFVPSKNGISHSPLEFTAWGDIVRAAQVVDKVVKRLEE